MNNFPAWVQTIDSAEDLRRFIVATPTDPSKRDYWVDVEVRIPDVCAFVFGTIYPPKGRNKVERVVNEVLQETDWVKVLKVQRRSPALRRHDDFQHRREVLDAMIGRLA